MFRRAFECDAQTLSFTFEGEQVIAHAGETVAAALLSAGHLMLRTTPVSSAARGPFCMMGVCFECLVDINGTPNLQACMTEAAQGMQVMRMHGARGLNSPQAEGEEQ